MADFYEFDNPTKDIRDSKKAETGNKVEGQKSYAETNLQLVREAKRLRRVNLLAKKRISFQNIAEEFDTLGYEAKKGGKHCQAGAVVNNQLLQLIWSHHK